ncbi:MULTISPECIES: group III truncated hemoglobin [unclassified Alcanivorax]|jgi:hemoglobin|uniref:group III truncated hemoglobin n=1 Tax=unclassified Alcanivorax TaxID=2638842 RepID=UPI0007B8A6D7|nr:MULTISPECIES: group III truncated hemoglobin [unclassified Alcanivorax]KZX73568.1 globin [Alcanivorax sp. HI0011]KZX79206.1 globin [Alcanivorax sp. HI0013]KZY20253.1 globin [Alcanivorax sp. HI0035]KZX64260.1 globin [Alcanivorax sp. HI0003]KZX68341.1 globin [Alcanivorax sp. HI0007]
MTVVQHFQPGTSPQQDSALADLDCRENIDAMVHGFYRRLLDDPVMAPMFLDVAAIDLQQHLPIICQYWYKMLLGEREYRRHMMAKHRALDDKQSLTGEHHERWLQHFMNNLDGRFAGPYTDRARHIAFRVMDNLYAQLSKRRELKV